ncbi:M28 family peptidase [Xanthomarina spongicola]|uniref:PA domain-containing protein n=1 Tax=Xanthomarina spongicola TaxID=570520 RepID=A0A316DNJ3_9FLAO|nr:M28 family peptidase [Xanthomarina spongicola]PWK19621.1 PA domain-containing protein [Xanthomarina spongicola]
MKKALLIICSAGLFYACGTQKSDTTTQSNVSVTPKPVDVTTYGETITSEELKTDLYIYASDDFEGRGTGDPGQKKAVNFLKERYITLGVPAAQSNKDYFQNVPLEKLGVPNVAFTVNDKAYTNIDDFVSIVSVQDGTLKTSEIVYAGYGIIDDNYTSYKDLDVKGKVVLIKSGEPKNTDGTFVITGTEETSKWSNFRQAFAAKRDVAKELGAKAVLVYYPEIYDMAVARFGSANGSISLKENTENMYYFLVNTDMAKTILPTIETEEKSQTINMPLSLDYKNVSEEISSENVAAIIKGTEKPDEYIIISAHLDHEGIKNGEIYNGADDDGSGSVALLEIAEAFNVAVKDGHGSKRSIVLLHVTAEEKGLLGSRYYTDMDPIFPLANTVANLNIDMIGRVDPKHEEGDGNYLYLIGSDKLSSELHTISEEVNNKYTNIVFDYTYNEDDDPNRFYYRSDHYNFAKNNIPVIFYFSGTHVDYHKPTDTPDKIRYDLLENRTRLIFYTAWELANRDKRIVVDKISE